MKETLASRVGRIIAGSFNALVDAVENAAPEVVMEQAIREVEEAMGDVRAELGKVIADKHLANSRLMQANQKHENLAEQSELAVKQGREDLATAAVAHQLDIEAQIPILQSQIGELSEREKELESYIAALQGKRREMQEELRLFRESRREAATLADSPTAVSGGGQATGGVESRVSQAESTFARILNNTAGGTSAASPDRKTAGQLAELEDLARQNRIKERLAALKSRVQEDGACSP